MILTEKKKPQNNILHNFEFIMFFLKNAYIQK